MERSLAAIGQRIRQARTAKGLSQADLAEILSVSVPHVSDIERGQTNCSITIFAAIAESLNVSADWLLNVDTPPSKLQRQYDLENLIGDCSPEEIEVILRTTKALKLSLALLRE